MRARRTVKSSSSPLTKYGIFFALIFLIVLVFGSFNRKSVWDGTRRFTVIFYQVDNDQRNPITLFSIEPKQGKAVFLKIPADTLLEVPYGYKTYPAGSVYRLGELEVHRGGGPLLRKSVESTLTISVDGYWALRTPDRVDLPEEPEEIKDFKQKYFTAFQSIRNLPTLIQPGGTFDTNISTADMVKLWSSIRALRPDQVTFLDLNDGHLLIDTPYPDGTSVRTLDPDAFDTYIGDIFFDSHVRLEHLSIEVANGTSQEKLASQFGKILDNMGANLIGRITSKRGEKEACVIYSTQPAYRTSVIVERLQSLYQCKFRDEQPDRQQADIIVILGEGYIK